MDCEKRITAIVDAIGRTERRSGRSPGSARLIAVSKARSAIEVRAAQEAGQRDFAENYLQEAIAKMDALSGLGIVWHFIGAIQSNKTRDIAQRFQWVHTVDRARIATRLNAAAERTLDVCIQVNIDAEPQKAGIRPDGLHGLVAQIRDLPRLRLRGLMTIPRADGNHRASFRALKSLFDKLAPDAGAEWDTLSMGMSDDYEAAIEEGATMVRIGTAIFGPRSTTQQTVSA